MAGHLDVFDTKTGQGSENKDIERGSEQLLTTTNNNQSDPVMREMATVILKEIELAHKRKTTNHCIAWIGILVGIIVIIVITALGGWTKGRRH